MSKTELERYKSINRTFLSMYYVLSIVLWASLILTHLILKKKLVYEVGNISILILQVRKLRHSEI